MQKNDFQRLVSLAIGRNRSQREFAKQADISQEHLSRMMKHPEQYKPSVATLRKISDASDGRVSLNALETACGYPLSPKAPAEEPDCGDGFTEARSAILEFKKFMLELSGKATRYKDEESILEVVDTLCEKAKYRCSVEDVKDFAGRGHAGAEKTANVTVEFATDEYKCTFGFVMFYCRTENGGVIFSDAAFDLPTLNEFDHPVGGRKLLEISTEKDADRSRYQTVYIVEKFS